MPKSQAARNVNRVAAAIEALLPRGFQRRSRTFNRTTTDGFVQVINLQMGPQSLGVPYSAAPSVSPADAFTVNLGVYIPEVARVEQSGDAPKFFQEYNCWIRARLGEHGPDAGNEWWSVAATDEVLPEVCSRVERDALPWLERYASRDAILREWNEHPEDLESYGRPARILAAIILAGRGDRETARALLARQADTPHAAHAAYVREVAAKLGMPLDDAPAGATK